MSSGLSIHSKNPAVTPSLQGAANAATASKEVVEAGLPIIANNHFPKEVVKPSVVPLPAGAIANYNKRWIMDPEMIAAKLSKVFQAAQEKIHAVCHAGASQIWEQANPEEFKSQEKIPLLHELPSQEFGSTLLEDRCFVLGVGVCCTQGFKKSMEDAYAVSEFTVDTGNGIKPVKMYGVFDGHVGAGCAAYLARATGGHLKKSLEEAFRERAGSAQDFRERESLEEMVIFNVLTTVFVELGEKWCAPQRKARSVALIALVIGNRLWVANVGDCRAILIDDDQVIALSRDAKPTLDKDDVFYKSVLKRGGDLRIWKDKVLRIMPVLCNMARAVGYPASGSGINPRAEVTKYWLTPGNKSTLILGCDGLWDFASSSQVAKAVTEYRKANPDATSFQIAEMLIKKTCRAVEQEGNQNGDNLTVIVADLANEEEEKAGG